MFAYLYILRLSGHWYAKQGRGFAKKFECRLPPTINSGTALTDTDCSSIYSPILSTVHVQYDSIARPAGVHYNRGVSPSVRAHEKTLVEYTWNSVHRLPHTHLPSKFLRFIVNENHNGINLICIFKGNYKR